MSNRLTFSLASLIVLIAFGVVLAPTSVMAHTDAQRNTDTDPAFEIASHTHPVKVAITADSSATPPVLPVPAHMGHRVPTLSLKAGQTNVRGSQVAVTADPNNTFTIVISFDDNNLSDDGTDTEDEAVTIASGSFTVFMLDKAGVPITGGVSVGESSAPDSATAKNEATVTIETPGLPATTGDDRHTLRLRLNHNAGAYALRQTLVADDNLSSVTVDGGNNSESAVLELTLVSALADAPSLSLGDLKEPTTAVTTGSFDIAYTTTPATGVSVAATHSVLPSFAADHYSLDTTSTAGTVTVNQAMPSATLTTVPAAVVTVTLTPNSTDGGDGEAKTFTVAFAARTLPNQRPTVDITTTAPTAAVTTGSFAIAYTTADQENDTVTVAVTRTTDPASALAHYTVADSTPGGTVTITQAAPTTATIPAASVAVTLTPSDAGGAGTAATITIPFASKASTDGLAADGYRVLVGSGFDATTLPGVSTTEVAGFPNDLAEYLVAGGTINVEATGGDVIINEMMVARDTYKIGSSTHDPADGQWIELYNKHATEAATGIKVTFNQEVPAVSPAGYADRFSNVAGQGWAFLTKFTDAAVLNGSSNPQGRVNFKSIRRTDAGKDGSDAGAWGVAEASLLFATGRIGTPGGQNIVDVFKPAVDRKPARSSVLISEVANRMNNDTEWIELKGPANQSLENWQLSIATEVGKESLIFTFPGNIRISPNGYLLLTDVDPLNSELEADWANGVHTPSRYKNAVVKLGALPNDGNFILILRNRKDRMNHPTHHYEGIQDIAGYDSDLSRLNPYTTLWPLTGNVGTINSKNKLVGGKVYRRLRTNIDGYSQEGGDGNKPAFGAVGFTGLGYDRNAPVINENGGTPGYPHGNFKGDGADAPGNVFISEIMYATGNGGPTRNRNLPQWIELHNQSDVHSVNLTNWRLEIVNAERNADGSNYDGKFSENVELSGTIPPNQTYLIVEHVASSNTRLPRERVKIVGKKFNENLLNPYGFHLTLKAKRHKAAHEQITVDTAGNLNEATDKRRSDSRSFAGNAWELEKAIAEDNSRISISRRYNAWSEPNVTATGEDKAGWILTDMDQRYSGLIQLTYYGRTDDLATPGYTIGGALPVQLSTFRPQRHDDGTIVIRWVTESELDNAGFNILRSETREGQFTKLNTQLIAGQGTTSERTAYEFTDKSAKPNVVYYYQIQDVSLDGDVATIRTARLRGHVSPAGKATTTWGELKALQ